MPRRSSGLWHQADFLKLWMGQSISVFGSLVGGVALPMLVVLILDATPMQMGILRSLAIAPGLLFGLFAGVWADRIRRRPLMLWSDILRALLMATVPALYFLGRLHLTHVYLITFATAILTVLFDVAYQSYLPSLVATADLVEANSKLQASSAIAEISGFGIAGVLVQLLTAPVTILVDAVSFVVSVLSLLSIRWAEPLPQAGEAPESIWQEMRAGSAALIRHPILRALLGAGAISNLFGNIIGTVIFLFVLRELRLAPALAGLLFALGGISSLGGALLATPALQRFGLGRTVIVAALLVAIGTACLPLAGGPLWVVILCLSAQQLIGDGAATVFIIHTMSLQQAVTPNRLMGRVGATVQVSGLAFQLVGTLLGGVLGEVIGLRGALVVAAAGQLLAVVWLYRSPVRALTEQPAVQG